MTTPFRFERGDPSFLLRRRGMSPGLRPTVLANEGSGPGSVEKARRGRGGRECLNLITLGRA